MSKIKKQNDNIKKSKKTSVKPEFIDTIGYQILPVVFFVLAIILLFFFIIADASGVVGRFVKDVLFGLFSYGAWVIPLALIKQVFSWKKDVQNNALTSNIIYSSFTVIFVSVFSHSVASIAKSNIAKELNPITLFNSGKSLVGGGAIGGLISSGLNRLIGIVPTLIISSAVLLVFVIFMVGLTPIRLAEIINKKVKDKKQELDEKTAKRAEERIEREKKEERKRIEEEKKENLGKKRERVIEGIIEESDKDLNSENTKNIDVKNDFSDPLDLEEIFVNKENLELSKKMLAGNEKLEPQEAEISIGAEATEEKDDSNPVVETEKIVSETVNGEGEKEYQFPPISFLTKDSTTVQDVTEELNSTADKLVRTLESFGVKTTVVNVSRGPTVTRYELEPNAGVKVRSIGNLVDDIALHLAAKGAVRIEAPIPGKSAVGIEIPNQNSSMVRLRGLIENQQFSDSNSKLTCVLGEDVAGNPIYTNIAAMPHMLIAGATGMGKSVCINSLIISILYKARPDEVKLILIDPKKVELNMYNGIPHLIVPVVSDPKKAAGSLRWAVGEMERRFQLMDECGARDLAGYNTIAKTDDEYEVLPEIVIIIDELADLMMTAPADVEDTVCRIAQKARAAGMHLIIGTQRPSVDVITGLIKANIPSRIAFTVASQVDSRTIIDIAGAEKLCGKGDMLYAPVGISKPIRVQGSFVSTSEVEKVCEFLKNQFDAEYDESVAESIEKEAAKCGIKGAPKEKSDDTGDGSDIDSSSDEMLPKAIEIAVEAGQNGISTSMLQRRLAIGYARAGRIIDTMEHMGVIGGFEGSKPRKVLITKEQYLEMKMHGEESESTESENI